MNVLDLNKKLKYFGEFLQVEYKRLVKTYPEKEIGQDMKVNYLSKKFEELNKQVKPKLCIMNFATQQKMTFINYLEKDEYYK